MKTPLASTGLCKEPGAGSLGIADARIVVPREPACSVVAPPVLRVTRLALALALMVTVATVTPTTARADLHPRPPLKCQELPCSVIRNCSSTGMACEPDDRECTAVARDKDLEVKCEQPCDEGKQRLVYCPPDTGRSDSNVVWFLLSFALVLAIGGISLAWIVLRKKKG